MSATYEVRLATVEARPTVVAGDTAELGELPATILRLSRAVYAALDAAGVPQDALGGNVVLYLAAGADPSLALEAGVELLGPRPDLAGGGAEVPVVLSSLPAGRVATTVHRGPYAELPAAHTAVRAWCRDQGLALAGPHWEVYGDWSDDPAGLETDVSYLLKPSR